MATHNLVTFRVDSDASNKSPIRIWVTVHVPGDKDPIAHREVMAKDGAALGAMLATILSDLELATFAERFAKHVESVMVESISRKVEQHGNQGT